jgi:hypothetical protein
MHACCFAERRDCEVSLVCYVVLWPGYGLMHAPLRGTNTAACCCVCRVLRPGSAGSARSSDPSSRGSSKPVSRANSQQLEAEPHSGSSAQALQQASQALHAYAGAGAGASSPSSTGAVQLSWPDSPVSSVGPTCSSSHAAHGSQQTAPSRLGRHQQQQQQPPGDPPSSQAAGNDEDPAIMEFLSSALNRPAKRRGGGGSPAKKS